MAEIYNSNANLKAAGVSVEFTPDNIQEYIKCSQDPIYFIENYCYIVTLDFGLKLFKLYDCQRTRLTSSTITAVLFLWKDVSKVRRLLLQRTFSGTPYSNQTNKSLS